MNIKSHLEEVVRAADVVLQGGPAGEVASPEAVRSVSIREEVVFLRRPRPVGAVDIISVAGGCGVQQVHVAALGLLCLETIATSVV